MNIERYKRQLLAEEKRLLKEMKRTGAAVREAGEDPTGDAADRSVSGEQKESEFQEVDKDWAALRQVRDALRRIEEGTYGKCVVDGEPIDENRLNALPWTLYCMKHQQSLENSRHEGTPTL